MMVSSEYETVRDLRIGVKKSRVLVRNTAVLMSLMRKDTLYLDQWMIMKAEKQRTLVTNILVKMSSS